MKQRELILDVPSMQTLWQKYSSALLTFIFWVLWFFLWMPVITALAWYFGFEIMYFEMFEMSGYQAVIRSFLNFLLVVFLLGGALASWAGYNYIRFKGKDKRSTPMQVSTQQQADYLNTNEHLLSEFQHQQRLSVSFDDHGAISKIAPCQTAENQLKTSDD